MATSDRPVWISIWLRWFGSRPHLVGAAVALLLVGAALLGVLETLLRPHFGVWWLVVLAGYLVGWLLTSIVMWLPGRLRPGVEPRPWASTVLPELAAPRETRVRESKARFTVGMVVFVGGVSFLLLILLSAAQAEAVGAIMSGMAAMSGLLLVWASNARPANGDTKATPASGAARSTPNQRPRQPGRRNMRP